MKPTIGRIVHYKLPADISSKSGQNPHQAGQEVPMIIVVVWPNEYGPGHEGVNGQAFLDGNESLWVTSAKEGNGNGEWHWPEINT